MAGRRPKPTAVKMLAGNPGHRPLNMNEPKPTGIPTCPRFLDTQARAEWKRISKELLSCGLLTMVDRAALAAYCQCWSRWVVAEQNLAKYGMVVKAPSGYPIQNPYVTISNTALDNLRKYMIEFGMTPAARTKVHATITTPTEDEWSQFVGEPMPVNEFTN